MRPEHWDEDPAWDGAWTVRGYRGVAWRVLGWELWADEDTEWSGCYQRSGWVLAHMVGDDRYSRFDPKDLTKLDDEDFCHECGQVGCTHDGLEREEE